MVEKYAIVLTGSEDPMWPFLQKECDREEKKKLLLYPTDRPDLAMLEYGYKKNDVIFNICGHEIHGREVVGIWMRRLVPPNLDHFTRDLKDYCHEEYASFYEGLEHVMSDAVWVSRPSAINTARNKMLQLVLAKKLGFNLLSSSFTNSPKVLESAIRSTKPYIYKAVNSPRIPLLKKRFTTVFTTRLEESHLVHANQILSCPGIIQEFCDKSSDIRVTIIGNRIFPVEIFSQEKGKSKVDFRFGAKKLRHVPHNLPSDISEKCSQLVKKLGLKFGAIDLALLNDGTYIFFEINPNGQWGWLEQKCKLPMRRALLDLLFKKGR